MAVSHIRRLDGRGGRSDEVSIHNSVNSRFASAGQMLPEVASARRPAVVWDSSCDRAQVERARELSTVGLAGSRSTPLHQDNQLLKQARIHRSETHSSKDLTIVYVFWYNSMYDDISLRGLP
jgi:hypothetical protein